MTEPTSAVPTDTAPDACPGYGDSRRRFLRAAGLTVAGSAGILAAGTWTRTARAATPTDGDVLVVLSLHGGMDGLSVAAPVGDANYQQLRPTIALRASQAIRLDGTFGMHPALAPLKTRLTAGQFGIVHAVGAMDRTRSHFESMDHLERADTGSSLRTGWLNRVIGLRPGGLWGAAQLGNPVESGALAGPAPVTAIGALADVTFAGAPAVAPLDRWDTALAALHDGFGSPLAVPTHEALAATVDAAAMRDKRASSGYPATPLAAALADVAAVIRSDQQVRLAVVDSGDWDHHVDLASRVATNLGDLAAALAAFADDLGDLFARVTVVTVSEFGRRAAENGSAGSDHGHGNAVLVLSGAGLARGPVFGVWPGLAPDQLDDGDLAGTTDYRDVLGEALTKRCGLSAAELGTVFPGYRPRPVGAFVARS